jgi:hypothetical protein
VCTCMAVLADGKCSDLFAEYIPRDKALEKAVDDVSRLDTHYRHYVLFLQSSGYGKTRACLNLLENVRPGVYLLCVNVANGFNSNTFVKTLMDTPVSTTNVVRFLMKLENFMDSFPSRNQLFKAQFDMTTHKYQADFIERHGEQQKQLDEEELRDIVSRIDQDVAEMKKVPFSVPENRRAAKYVVVFDEAHALGAGLMAMLKRALDHFKMVGVFLSTCGHLACYRSSSQTAQTP